jgi:phospholipid transport system substrate-binding protein
MNTMYHKISGALLTLSMAITSTFTVSAFAAEKAEKAALEKASPVATEKTPQSIVEKTTADLFATVKKYNATGNKTEAYYTDVEKTLNAVVDFPYIAKAVMRKSAKTASPEQVEKFTVVFKSGLIQTYAKGIANYADSKVSTLPLKADADATRVTVDQEVSDKGNTHKLSYTMRYTKDIKEWKLINVVLNGVNLGETFTSQFDQAMIKNDNNVDKVIATWLATK